ncbi:MAG: hypothetical protein FWB73_00880 [Treponema sp.]|nr:hypothetical protein [Treponema sp.]
MEKAEIEKIKERLTEIERIQIEVDSEEFEGIYAELLEYKKKNTDPEIIAKINELLENHKSVLIKLLENQSSDLNKLKREYEEKKKIIPDLYIPYLE